MYKQFTKCPKCHHKEVKQIRPCKKKDCTHHKEMKLECTMCKHNENKNSSISFYRQL